ncbi:NmrA family transcriptional regulator [Mycobacterium sp. Root265]|uniref:NmrA/HSCARG family protein n=1 Tax=Mycobacterium sp. Root265 TaxID=1736504 RepID=UPI00070E2647|nr:NmrA/HSCARG family protein [Mycobacterium sp. Root265]KRD09810.1 NmrA family transcriptional regulator [Mycobacterium sp. Root265]
MTGHFVVLGATGAQGGAVVRALLESGATVRGITRRTDSASARRLSAAGVEVVAADLSDETSVAQAFTGVDGAYALTTPFEDGPEAEVAQGRTILDAALAAQVPHLVFSSVADADQHTGIPHFDSKAEVEESLARSGLSYTIVGPSYFYDNMLGGLDDIKAGVFALPLPADTTLQQLSRRDLGRFVAAVLTDPDPVRGMRIDIASDEPTPQQMTAAIAAALGKPVRLATSDPDDIGSDDMRAMFGFLAAGGYTVDIPALHAQYPQVGWQSFTDWIDTDLRPLLS